MVAEQCLTGFGNQPLRCHQKQVNFYADCSASPKSLMKIVLRALLKSDLRQTCSVNRRTWDILGWQCIKSACRGCGASYSNECGTDIRSSR
jgi:hypothetical protein